MEILLFTLDLVKKETKCRKKHQQAMVKNESLPPKATYGSNFQMPKKMYPRLNAPPASLGFAQVWQTPKQLGTVQRLRGFFVTSNYQFSWNRVPLAKTSSWKYDDIFFHITMFPEEPTTTLNLAPVHWGHQDLCEMGSGSSSLAFFRSHLWM